MPTTVVKSVQVDNESTTSLLIGKSGEIGNNIKRLRIPVIVDEPKDAILKIDFKISDAGHCQTSYQPTVLYLNTKELVSFDFRKYFLQTRIKRSIKISKEHFVQGENIVEIRSGACDYDIDVFDLNGLLLEIN